MVIEERSIRLINTKGHDHMREREYQDPSPSSLLYFLSLCRLVLLLKLAELSSSFAIIHLVRALLKP